MTDRNIKPIQAGADASERCIILMRFLKHISKGEAAVISIIPILIVA